MLIQEILKNSDYTNHIFTDKETNWFENRITEVEGKKGKEYKTVCVIRNKEIKITPEEVVRQLYAYKLIEEYGYPVKQIQFEYPIKFGREAKRADIVIVNKLDLSTAYIIAEIKKPKAKDGKDQLKSYCNGTGATMAVWTNGENINFFHRKNPNFFEPILGLPNADQSLADFLNNPFTLQNLIDKEKLHPKGKTLKNIIEDMEDEVLANAGVDVFEEVFKLIFAKLYDEMQSGNEPERSRRNLEFYNHGHDDIELKEKIQKLFNNANKDWAGVFPENTKINLTPTHLSVCVSSLQDYKLFNSNLEVVDNAFEYLMQKSSKGEKGQYFTPRYVIDMCVRMMNPKPEEFVIDTAAGSSGFTVHSIFHVWRNLLHKLGLPLSHMFTAENKPKECSNYVKEKVFAIDFDEKAVRVSRALNLIAGDGQTNVLQLNTLDFTKWDLLKKDDEDWDAVFGQGFNRLKKLCEKRGDYNNFNFDLVMANPPFAGDIKETTILTHYELARQKGNASKPVGRDILFIERNLKFLKPGGRMAVVLPQGRFNNSSDKYIREYIAEHCRILAVVGLHGNSFKPHTGTKTSVLFVQKWDDTLCPKKDDYNIFFATQQISGKNNSGEPIYWKKDNPPKAEYQSNYETYCTAKSKDAFIDGNNHPIIAQDLINYGSFTFYDNQTETENWGFDGIAEAFAEFAKKENLSFF
ncbi:MAG: type I restriction endonuclease subunit M [Bacteroidetes bacterium GWE2_29_8]|nr:MAG: type I restriction endonuclease subunit M [Bacteroidetes bacterium GWE2_29_8]